MTFGKSNYFIQYLTDNVTNPVLSLLAVSKIQTTRLNNLVYILSKRCIYLLNFTYKFY